MKSIKVLMVVFRLDLGGTEKYILTLSRALRSLGVSVGVATFGGPLERTFIKNGIRVHKIPYHFQRANQVGKVLKSIIRSKGYHIVHAHDTESFRHVAALNNIQYVPTLLTLHGTYHLHGPLLAASKGAKKIIAVSPQLVKWAVQHHIPFRKIRIIPNAIDTSLFRPSASTLQYKAAMGLPIKTKMILNVSRYDKFKYPIAKKVMISVYHLLKTHSNIMAVFAGPGPYRRNLEHLAARINRKANKRVIWIRPPVYQGLERLYKASDVVVGTGRVALEAMACGKPVIAAGAAGYLGIVTPNKFRHAVFTHFGDHSAVVQLKVPKLMQDLNSLLSHSGSARKVGLISAKFVKKRYSIQHVVRRIYREYKQLV